ncbi:MAG TPA: hypothetical protein VFB61_05280 [Gemmatimonadales bacterium]|nr:hypothetical protein [Gemmatimonadales bacterium]
MSSPISAIALVLVLSCVSPEQKAELAAHDLRSWVATARMTADALAVGTVPQLYGRQVLDAALESRRRLAQRSEWNAIAPELRDSLQSSLRGLALALGQPADSVGVTP